MSSKQTANLQERKNTIYLELSVYMSNVNLRQTILGDNHIRNSHCFFVYVLYHHFMLYLIFFFMIYYFYRYITLSLLSTSTKFSSCLKAKFTSSRSFLCPVTMSNYVQIIRKILGSLHWRSVRRSVVAALVAEGRQTT